MILLTALLSVLFAVQFLTQFNSAMRRMSTRAKIRTGRLSYRDIVSISRQQFNADMMIDSVYYHYNLSANSRLYKYQIIDGHKSVIYINRDSAIMEIQFH